MSLERLSPFENAVLSGVINRYNYRAGEQRIAIALCEQETPKCFQANAARTTRVCGKGKLTLHHIDGDRDNWALTNIVWSCQVHQLEAERKRRSSGLLCVKEDVSPPLSSDSERRKSIVGSNMGETGRANDLFEPPYRAWLEAQIRKSVFLGADDPTKEYLVNFGAEQCKCSPASILRYYGKQVSPRGSEDDPRPYFEYVSQGVARVKVKPRTIEAWKVTSDWGLIRSL